MEELLRLEGVYKSYDTKVNLLARLQGAQVKVYAVDDACFTIREGETLPDQLVLTSPIDGYVLQLMPNLNPDVLLPAQATPVTVGQLDPVLIQVPVYEGDLGRIKEGGHARVEIPSLGDKVFSATITEISWISTNMDVAQPSYYTVELTVPNSQLELKPGFKALVRFGAAE